MIRQYVCGAGKVIIRQVIVTTGFLFNQQKMHGQISSYISCVLRLEDDVLRSRLNTLIAFIQDFQAAVGKPISYANSLIRISFT